MSKRKADNTYITKDTETVNTRSQYKRARLNEEGQDADPNYQNNEEIKGGEAQEITPATEKPAEDQCDRFLKIFYDFVLNLHDYNQKNCIDKNSGELNEEQKAANGQINHDESVRLQQEPEIEEVEQKSNRDKNSKKVNQEHQKLEEKSQRKYKNIGKNSNQDGNHQEVNVNPNIQPNTANLETPQVLPEKKEVMPTQMPSNPYANWNPQKQDTQVAPEVQSQLRNTSQPESVQERNYNGHKQLPASMMHSLMQSAQSQRAKSPVNVMDPSNPAMSVSHPPAQPQYYAAQGVPRQGIQVIGQQRPMMASMPKMNYPVQSNPSVQPNLMQPGYNYGVRVQPGYVAQSNYNMPPSRMPAMNVTLPGVNQLSTMLSNQNQMTAQTNQQQIPQAYLQQARMKNMMINQARAAQTQAQNQAQRMEYQYQAMGRGAPNMQRNWNPNNPYGYRPN